MCRVCESAAEVREAADELVRACNAKVSLRRLWNRTLEEPVPTQLLDVLRRAK